MSMSATLSIKDKKRICIVTGGHLSTCPRMVKAADALAHEGHDVRVVSTNFIDWAQSADTDLLSRRKGLWRSLIVDYHPRTNYARYVTTGLRHRAANFGVQLLGTNHTSPLLVEAARTRVSFEIARLAASEPCDLIYGGGSALAATAKAARRLQIPYGFDLEDFHSGEGDESAAAVRERALTEVLESSLLPNARFLTAGSEEIAAAYSRKFKLNPVTINNTFSLARNQPDFENRGDAGLRFYWFSQTIGPGRGLEDPIRAIGIAGVPAELHLRGRIEEGYFGTLNSLAKSLAPSLTLVHLPPAMPDDMVELCLAYDVGLAIELGSTPDRALCLTNKALTYTAAGLGIVLTDTPGQRRLAVDLGPGAILYPPGDATTLAAKLHLWATDSNSLAAAKRATWQAAQLRWNWDHPLERGRLLACVTEALES
jgi:glycosyltransferase involved in cell wall biosynthesis